jgi:predicted transcriptional regulator
MSESVVGRGRMAPNGSTQPSTGIADVADGDSVEPAVETAPERVLDLLDDDHARAILAAVADAPRPARDVVETVEASRATVYRRLNSLEAAGLVETSVSVDPDGHHRQVYRSTLSRLTVSIDAEGVAVETVAGD